MKKKLLTVLLSFAMVMTMIPFASITAFAVEIQTVGDVLNTVEGFPIGEYLEPPYDAWINENGDEFYKNSENFYFNGNGEFPLSIQVVESNGNYVATYAGCTFTFNMEEGVLQSIDFTSVYPDSYADALGTYAPNPNPVPAPNKGDLVKKVVKGVVIAGTVAVVAKTVANIAYANAANYRAMQVAMQKQAVAKAQQKAVQGAVVTVGTVATGATLLSAVVNFKMQLDKIYRMQLGKFYEFRF